MDYIGEVERGNVALKKPLPLADGTRDKVTPVRNRQSRKTTPSTLSEFLLSYAGKCDGLPEDSALNHDLYLYGVPKK